MEAGLPRGGRTTATPYPTLFRRAGAVALVAAAAAALAGCGGGIGATLTFNDVEKVKVNEIVLDGSSGDVEVSTSAINETRITRIVHSDADPGLSYTLTGSQLHLGTSCGHDCRVSYRIEAPAGVAVTGELRSGNVALTGVGNTDVHVSSGDIDIHRATGRVQARATSGEVTVTDSTGPATLVATSGDINAVNIGGAVAATASSGEIQVRLDAPASVTAVSSSGDVNVVVPAGKYHVRTRATSGDVNVDGITDDPSAKNVLDVRASSGDVTVTTVPTA
jgi:Putative adhesin